MPTAQRVIDLIEEIWSASLLPYQYAMWNGSAFVPRGKVHRVTLGNSGADYTDPTLACEYVATQGPATDNLWQIEVQPGSLFDHCNPWTIPAYTVFGSPIPTGQTGLAFNSPHCSTFYNDTTAVRQGALAQLSTGSVLYGCNIHFLKPTGGITGEAITVNSNGTAIGGVVLNCYLEMFGDAGTYDVSVCKNGKLLIGNSSIVVTSNPGTYARGCWAYNREQGLFNCLCSYQGGGSGARAAFEHNNSNASAIRNCQLFTENGFRWDTTIIVNPGGINITNTAYESSSVSGYLTDYNPSVFQAFNRGAVPITVKPYDSGQTELLFRALNSVGGVQFGIDPAGKIRTNQAVTNINTPGGATAKAMPVYDAAGTLLGYVPLYGSQW